MSTAICPHALHFPPAEGRSFQPAALSPPGPALCNCSQALQSRQYPMFIVGFGKLTVQSGLLPRPGSSAEMRWRLRLPLSAISPRSPEGRGPRSRQPRWPLPRIRPLPPHPSKRHEQPIDQAFMHKAFSLDTLSTPAAMPGCRGPYRAAARPGAGRFCQKPVSQTGSIWQAGCPARAPARRPPQTPIWTTFRHPDSTGPGTGSDQNTDWSKESNPARGREPVSRSPPATAGPRQIVAHQELAC